MHIKGEIVFSKTKVCRLGRRTKRIFRPVEHRASLCSASNAVGSSAVFERERVFFPIFSRTKELRDIVTRSADRFCLYIDTFCAALAVSRISTYLCVRPLRDLQYRGGKGFCCHLLVRREFLQKP